MWLGLGCVLVVFRLTICCWVWLFTAFDSGLTIGLIALNLLVVICVVLVVGCLRFCLVVSFVGYVVGCFGCVVGLLYCVLGLCVWRLVLLYR